MQRFIDGTHCVGLHTEEEFEMFMDMCEAEGLRWSSDKSPHHYTANSIHIDGEHMTTFHYRFDKRSGISYASDGDTLGYNLLMLSDLVAPDVHTIEPIDNLLDILLEE